MVEQKLVYSYKMILYHLFYILVLQQLFLVHLE